MPIQIHILIVSISGLDSADLGFVWSITLQVGTAWVGSGHANSNIPTTFSACENHCMPTIDLLCVLYCSFDIYFHLLS